MTRLLWPVVATLIIVAIGAPCLTFYLIIKDYWVEVAFLRQKLLYCQFSTIEHSTFSSMATTVSWEHPPLQDESPPLLPNPLPLTSDFGLSTSAENNFDSLPKTDSTEAPKDSLQVGQRWIPKLYNVPNTKLHPFQPLNSKIIEKDELFGGSSTTETLTLWNKPISDESKPKKDNLQEDEVCLPEEYVDKLEKRVVDLSTRLESCRKCLDSQLLKESRCGGGAAWKELRRNEKILRKEIREHKKKRRRKGKKDKENKLNVKNEEEMTSSSERNLTAEPTFEESTVSEPGFISMREWDSDASSFLNAHKVRENHRVSTDFRRGFNQKISRMDEALMQFTETQSAFCKELRDNLGGRLGKRGHELEALSEQIAALVRTTTIQMAMLEKLASDQVYAGQTGIEKNLANLQTLRDSQTRAIQDYHKKTFMPAMIAVISLLGEQASSVTNMGVDLITKVEMLQDVYLTFATKQGDTLVKVSEFVDMFVTKHSNLIMRSRDHAKHLHINTENFIRELQTRMNNVVKELVLVRLQSQSFISVNENTFHEISSSLNKTSDAVENMSVALQEKVNAAKEEETDFRKAFRKETDVINERIESGISRVLMNNHGAVGQIGEIDLETSVYSEKVEAAWNELYSNQETELRQEADMLANNLRSHNHHTQNVLTGLQGTAGTHEQVLEQQRMDFQNFIRNRQDALDTQCSSINDWALLMSSELRRRDEDLHRFLSEELRFSPVPVKETNNYNDYLVSRLPDGTFLYDSSPSDSSHYQGWPQINQTSHLKEMNPESWVKSSNFSTGSTANTTLPVSSPSNLLINTPSTTNLDAEKEPDSSSINQVNIKISISQKPDQSFITITTPPFPQSNDGENQLIKAYANNDTLSNDIRINKEEIIDNTISVTQNDQSLSNKSNSTTKRICKDNSTTLFPNVKNGTEDEEFVKLKDIVMEAKKTILKFQKDFDISDDFREVRKTIWKKFHNRAVNQSAVTLDTKGHELFNFSKSSDKQIKDVKNKTSEKKVGNKIRHKTSKSVNSHRINKRKKKLKKSEIIVF